MATITPGPVRSPTIDATGSAHCPALLPQSPFRLPEAEAASQTSRRVHQDLASRPRFRHLLHPIRSIREIDGIPRES
jgi:hypothetical protein